MNNETKRDVLKKALDFFVMYGLERSANYDMERHQYLSEYDAALPDDLPVVSKDVSNIMRTYRFIWWKEFLDKAYDNELIGYEDINYKVRSESAEVARALILGVWRVEETGEIVKLEAEK